MGASILAAPLASVVALSWISLLILSKDSILQPRRITFEGRQWHPFVGVDLNLAGDFEVRAGRTVKIARCVATSTGWPKRAAAVCGPKVSSRRSGT